MRSSRLKLFFVLIVTIATLSIVVVIVLSNKNINRIENAAKNAKQDSLIINH